MSNLMSCRDLPSGMFFTRLGRALISKCIVGLCLLVAPGLGVAQSVVTGWGADYYGQATAPAGLTKVTAISGGCEYSLALKSDGTVAQWGGGPNAPVGTPASADFAAIAAGCFHALALKFDGTVFAWGYNGNGQTDVPADLTNVVAIAAGVFHSLALKSNGTVVAWGSGVVGQSDVPAGLEGVVAIAAGERHSLALKSDGTVVGWGFNDFGQLDIPAGLADVVAIASSYHNLALKSDGSVVAWGLNDHGQATVPAGLSGVVAIASGGGHSLALRSDGTVVAWGRNDYGQVNVPLGLTRVTAIAAGSLFSLAMRATPLTPEAAIQQLQGDLRNLDIGRGIKASLIAKLDKLLKILAVQNRPPACPGTRSFASEVAALSGKHITLAQADYLLAQADEIEALIGCGENGSQ